MPTPTTRRSSRSAIEGPPRSGKERREKAKSGTAYYETGPSSQQQGRRGSRQAEMILEGVPERSQTRARTNSAPFIGAVAHGARRRTDESRDSPSRAGPGEEGQDEDEVAGVVGAVRKFEPFSSAELPLPDINIAVIGAEGVGKTTFMQQALTLPSPPPTPSAERKIPIDNGVYLVRLLELDIDDVAIHDEDNTVSWPETIGDRMMPRIDGALTLYNVTDKSSLEEVPDVLSAIGNTGIPSILIACKCDVPAEEREVDPIVIESSAKRSLEPQKIPLLATLQTSLVSADAQKRGISMMLRTIVAESTSPPHPVHPTNPNNASRKPRAQSIVSGRPPGAVEHASANSESIGSVHEQQLQQEERHRRHDSSITALGSNDRLKIAHETAATHDAGQGSFLIEESGSDMETESESDSADGPGQASVSTSPVAEQGETFDELVDQLLAQPTSKADSKFIVVFLALFRHFAAPGRLLEAIVERFDALERNGGAQITTTVHQLRYLSIVEQWIRSFPGDFAHSKTKRRMRTLVDKLSLTRIFSVAAKEIGACLDTVREDDDTHWACNDKDREASGERATLSPSASALIDDPMSSFADELSLSGMDTGDEMAEAIRIKSASGSSYSTYSHLQNPTEVAQRRAQTLQPTPRISITKNQWRLLFEMPDDIIARELTRIDWLLFTAIRPRDLIRHVSLSAAPKAACKDLTHVNHMIDHFNHLAFWVANYLLIRDKPKHRALMLEKFMRVARKLREMNNYNALGAIIAGVKSTSIHRLGATRDIIPPAVGKDWLKLEILMAPSRSHFAYRLAWENSSTERIPYLPLLRRDLVSAEEANRTFVDEPGGRINWKKFEIKGEVVVGMQKAQGMPYKGLGGTPSSAGELLKELLLDVKLVKDEDVSAVLRRIMLCVVPVDVLLTLTAQELFERSKQLEPSGTAGASGGPSTKLKEFFKR